MGKFKVQKILDIKKRYNTCIEKLYPKSIRLNFIVKIRLGEIKFSIQRD